MSWSAVRAPKREAWTVDRNWNRSEGERLLKDRRYEEAGHYLRLATADAEVQKLSVGKRIRVRLQLSEALRRQENFDEAEQVLRKATDLAARVSDTAGYLMCLDGLA